jgi:uncharacterized membrane protein
MNIKKKLKDKNKNIQLNVSKKDNATFVDDSHKSEDHILSDDSTAQSKYPTAKPTDTKIYSKTAQVKVSTTFTGPLPPPEIAEQYQKMLPSFMERSMKLLEKELDNRYKIENKTLDINFECIKLKFEGQKQGRELTTIIIIVGWAITLIVLLFAPTVWGNIIGVIWSGVSIVPIAETFILNKKYKEKSND